MTNEREEERQYGLIFRRLDRAVKEGRLFLDYEISLVKVARIAGTNRTYASRAVCERFKNFKEYMNGLRVGLLMEDMEHSRLPEAEYEDPDDFANHYGFRTRRSLDRVLVRERGMTYSAILKDRRRHRSGFMPESCR